MSPAARELAEFLDARQEHNASELSTLFTALKRGRWNGGTRLAATVRVRLPTQQATKWKERSGKKNPDKARDHRDTLLVLGWLAGR